MNNILGFVALALLLSVSVLVLGFYTSPLKSIPGPFLARFTDLWRLLDVWIGRADLTQQALHKRYGRYVRLGPKFLSTTDPAAIKDLYTTRNAFPKSAFYAVADFIREGRRTPSQFSARDEAWHTKTMRPIVKFYSMSSVLEYEPLIDNTITSFLDKVNTTFVNKRDCDIDNWLHYYAWDVIGQITFSKPLGFLDKGGDIDDLLYAGKRGFDYLSVVGQMPWLDAFLDKNRVFRIGPPAFDGLITFTAQQLFGRLGGQLPQSNDFLNRFVSTKDTDPDIVDQERLFAYTLINVSAGSDTTAITLRSAIYYILRDSDVHARLRKEIQDAALSVPVSWKAVQSLPFLDAAIKESMRLHPAVGLPLERTIDERGLRLPNGLFLPSGVTVGKNPAAIHRDQEVFGADADEFKPSRWLQQAAEGRDEFEKRCNAMDKAMFTFGYGSRSCVGRHVAILEVYKLIASLFASFRMELAHPDREWKVRNSFFNRQWDMDVSLKALEERS